MIDENGPAAADEVVRTDDGGLGEVASLNDPLDIPASGFAEMNLDPDIQQALADMRYLEPMEVQTAVFRPVMDGHDIMVQSRTGSGKTAAFGIPIAQKLSPEVFGAQVLILAPTRELGLQVAEERSEERRVGEEGGWRWLRE